jgi:hypothetical protein
MRTDSRSPRQHRPTEAPIVGDRPSPTPTTSNAVPSAPRTPLPPTQSWQPRHVAERVRSHGVHAHPHQQARVLRPRAGRTPRRTHSRTHWTQHTDMRTVRFTLLRSGPHARGTATTPWFFPEQYNTLPYMPAQFSGTCLRSGEFRCRHITPPPLFVTSS